MRKKYPQALIVNVFHWGFEFNTLPMPKDIQLAHQCIESGCNYVIGHHPHVIQPHELYKKGEVYYSLGNFYFSSRRSNFVAEIPKDSGINQCDIGIGVILDLDTRKSSCLSILYDRNRNVSYINTINDYLKEFTEKDWNSENYRKKVKRLSTNFTPVLGVDKEENKKAIRRLYAKYYVAKRMRFLKNSYLGRRLFDFLKKR